MTYCPLTVAHTFSYNFTYVQKQMQAYCDGYLFHSTVYLN